MDNVSILVLGDQDFGRIVEFQVSRICLRDSLVRHIAWEQSAAIWSTRIFQQTDLFIVELFRRYPTGFRAEGMIAADLILQRGSLALVVSPFSVCERSEAAYGLIWDPGDPEPLVRRVQSLIEGSTRQHDASVLGKLAKQINRDDQLFTLHR